MASLFTKLGPALKRRNINQIQTRQFKFKNIVDFYKRIKAHDDSIEPKSDYWREYMDGEDVVKSPEVMEEEYEERKSISKPGFIKNHHWHKFDFSASGIKFNVQKMLLNRRVETAMQNQNKISVLGSDLSAAQYFTYQGAAVKFIGQPKFISKKTHPNLTSSFPHYPDSSYKLEAINLEDMGDHFIYESLIYLEHIKTLKWISFRGLENFDNWCLDRLCKSAPSIEYLDISKCKNVDHNGLIALYRFKNLRCLNVADISETIEFKLTCLTIEAENPSLVVVGALPRPKMKSAFSAVP